MEGTKEQKKEFKKEEDCWASPLDAQIGVTEQGTRINNKELLASFTKTPWSICETGLKSLQRTLDCFRLKGTGAV